MTTRCLYFGCWNQAGHFLRAPGGASVPNDLHERATLFAPDPRGGRGFDGKPARLHLDGSLAPRRNQRTNAITCDWLMPQRDEQHRMNHSGECPQGQFLCHVLPNGFTAVQWWDRTQGDTRPGCNSTILLEGDHTSEEVLAVGRQHFPHVFENLDRAGIALVEVHMGDR